MPYLDTAQSWLTQSTLLLKARPTTTHITTKYTISLPTSKKSRPGKSKSATSTIDPAPPAANPTPVHEVPRAALTLKTFDPVSGATLKYSTNKAAEVSRLIQILGKLARPMSGLPEAKDDVGTVGAGAGAGAGAEGEGSGAGTHAIESVPAIVGGGKPGQQAHGGGAGGKKKKKGKK